MSNKTENIEVLFKSLSVESQEKILLYTKLIAEGEANGRRAESARKEASSNATA